MIPVPDYLFYIVIVLCFLNLLLELYKIRLIRKTKKLEDTIYKELAQKINQRIYAGPTEDTVGDIRNLILEAFNPDYHEEKETYNETSSN